MTDGTEYSQIYFFDVDKNEFEFANQKAKLDGDLGQSHLRAKYSKELKEKEEAFLLRKKEIEIENAILQNSIAASNKPSIFVEDKYTQLYKIAWLKLNGIECNRQNFEALYGSYAPCTIFPAEGASPLAGFMRTKNLDYWTGKKVIGIFDFDIEGVAQFNSIKDKKFWNTDAQGTKETGIYKQRTGHNSFYTMLLPIPKRLSHLADLAFPSYVEVENLLPESFLTDNGLSSEKRTTGNTSYLEVKHSKKPTLWEMTFVLTKVDFLDFKPLFETVNNLFDIVKDVE